ncbi:neuroligin-3-like [Anneissia japonica]|uniref:neuroligin-3-like n=1 Tax=Anneissia japonica TaxID=1529436 RepID=UPI0014258EC4|nr:neuroligin-3-like [Anneissia japonica]
MVFIHGGDFRSGAGSIYNGSILASFGEVVVVTVNFRLGILGFLSSGNDVAKGNYGLQDQIAALQWIQDNISAFNGDKSRVTVVGAGSGAASSGILALSNRTSGLIHRVIAQGGSPLVPWVMSTEPSTYFKRVAERFGCQKKSDSEIIDQLRKTPIDELLQAEQKIRAPLYFIAFGPVVDGDIIADMPINLLRDVQNKISFMTGFTEGDAYEFVEVETDNNGKIPKKDYEEVLRGFVQNNYGMDMNFCTDKLFDLLYIFSFACVSFIGSVFLDEVQFVVGAPLLLASGGFGVYMYNYTRKEAQISLSVMTYWSNFAKTGNPNDPRSQESTSLYNEYLGKDPYIAGDPWPAYTVGGQQFLHIGQKRKENDFFRLHKVSFWEHYIPKVEQILSGVCYEVIDDGGDITQTANQLMTSPLTTRTITTTQTNNNIQKLAPGATLNSDGGGGAQMSIVLIVGAGLLLLNFTILFAIYYIHQYRKKYRGNMVVNNNNYNDAMIARAVRKDSTFDDDRLMTRVAAERLANHSRGNGLISPNTKMHAEKNVEQNEYEMDV